MVRTVLLLLLVLLICGLAYLMFADVPAPVTTIETPVASDKLGAN